MRSGIELSALLIIASKPLSLAWLKSTLLAFLTENTWLLGAIVILLLLGICLTLGLLWFRQRSRYYLQQYKIEQEQISSLGTSIKGLNIPADLFSKQIFKPIKHSQLFNAIIEAIAGGKFVQSKTAYELQKERNNDMRPFSLKILIAEDSRVNQKILLRMLKQIGCDADVVSNGNEAIAAVGTSRYDIVFMDVHMPEKDGLEATKIIVNSMRSAERPKIIALTADALSGDRDKCIEAGMDDYITKPVRLAEVLSILKCWVPLQTRLAIESDRKMNQCTVCEAPVFSLAKAG
jgi:CheY-like chemotaxis protein